MLLEVTNLMYCGCGCILCIYVHSKVLMRERRGGKITLNTTLPWGRDGSWMEPGRQRRMGEYLLENMFARREKRYRYMWVAQCRRVPCVRRNTASD